MVFVSDREKRPIFYVIALVVCFSLISAKLSLAQQPSTEVQFRELRTRYLRIRNTDPEIQKPQVWIALAAQFEEFAERYPGHALSAKALISAAGLLEQLGFKLSRQSDQDRNIILLEKIVREYPSMKESDQALLKLGDLFRSQSDAQERARQAYTAIIERNKSLEMVIAARERLQLINRGKSVEGQENYNGWHRKNAPLPGQKVVVLDAGHGGEDVGAEGLGGLLEKDVVLDIVFRLEELLQARSDLFVHLTRRGDDFMPLAERTKMANLFKADLFISLHTNASPAGRMQGLETYYLDNTNNEASRKLAERENRFWADNSGTVQSDLQFMLSDLIQNMKKDDSIALAGFLHRSILQNVRSGYPGVKDLGVKKAPFYVLVGAHMPCVLLELLFIDNEKEGMLLANPEFRQELAKGIYTGINLFLSQ